MKSEQLPRLASNNRNPEPSHLLEDVTEPPRRRDLALLFAMLAGAAALFGLAVWKLAELVGL